MKLFVVILRYLVDITVINEHRPQHLDFLKKHSESGKIILSGRQTPLTGGVIVIKADFRNDVVNIMKEDPFIELQLAEINIFEFEPNALDGLRNFLSKDYL